MAIGDGLEQRHRRAVQLGLAGHARVARGPAHHAHRLVERQAVPGHALLQQTPLGLRVGEAAVLHVETGQFLEAGGAGRRIGHKQALLQARLSPAPPRPDAGSGVRWRAAPGWWPATAGRRWRRG